MQTSTRASTDSQERLWAGRIILALPVLFLLFDSGIKLMRITAVIESFHQLGYPESLALGIGILELVCIGIFLTPQTSILGAILLTGYLGGAVATHVRIGSPLVSHVFFPIYVGILIWGALLLREDRLRALFPLRSSDASRALSITATGDSAAVSR